MTIHEKANAFGPAASAYERGRPTYPDAAVAWLSERLDLRPGRAVVDLAAGTGKLTRLLVATGASIIAVEPVAGMRDELAARVPGIEIVDGTAESMPLPDGSADAVTAAQAFHWFDGKRALTELHRVLRPGGGLAPLWNRRDLSQPLQQALHDIVDRHRGTTPSHGSGAWRIAFEDTELFTPLEERRFPFVQELDADGLVDRVVSTSIIAALPQGERDAIARQVRALADDEGGRVSLHYETEVFVCRRRS
ncbi:MAG: hypothetical protein QOG64_2075 [Acidimicrobiaceae bacterium]|nr:hypothetical protein [Acidimicrobiaceae bacterium]